MVMRCIICIFMLSIPLFAAEMRGLVVAISDGDTIKVLDAQKVQHKIRLDAIDAPETGQAFGTQSKRYLSNLASGRNVRIVYSGTDRYGRILGTVFIGGRNINLMLVEAGYAWHYVQFAPDRREFTEAEARARKARKGLWADAVPPIPPWDYRKAKQPKQKEEHYIHVNP